MTLASEQIAKLIVRSVALLACVVLAHGCSVPNLGPSSLSTASVGPPQARPACPTAEQPKPISVNEVLAQARAADARKTKNGDGGPGDTTSRLPASTEMRSSKVSNSVDCLAVPKHVAADKTDVPPQSSTSAGGARPAGSAPGLHAELTIGFDSDNQSLTERDRQSIRDATRAHVALGHRRIRILAGAGGKGNPFDQLVIAQKRARQVRTLFTADLVVSVEYDPMQTEDTVRIEFVTKS